jgi:hypothetical protein
VTERKYALVLTDWRYKPKPDKDMGEVEGTFPEIEKLANHWKAKYDYDTWRLKVIPNSTKKRTKSSKKK